MHIQSQTLKAQNQTLEKIKKSHSPHLKRRSEQIWVKLVIIGKIIIVIDETMTTYSGWNWCISLWETAIVYASTTGMQPKVSHWQDSIWHQLWSQLLCEKAIIGPDRTKTKLHFPSNIQHFSESLHLKKTTKYIGSHNRANHCESWY